MAYSEKSNPPKDLNKDLEYLNDYLINNDLNSIFQGIFLLETPIYELTNLLQNKIQLKQFEESYTDVHSVISACQNGHIFIFPRKGLGGNFYFWLIFSIGCLIAGIFYWVNFVIAILFIAITILSWYLDKSNCYIISPSGIAWDQQKRHYIEWKEVKKIEEYISSVGEDDSWKVPITSFTQDIQQIKERFMKKSNIHWNISLYTENNKKEFDLLFFNTNEFPFKKELYIALVFHLYLSRFLQV